MTANEGDTRDYDGFSEEARVSSLTLDPVKFPNAVDLKQNAKLGRLTVTKANGDTDGDGDFDEIYAIGGRSFSIWTDSGKLVFDSGADFERIIADAFTQQLQLPTTPPTTSTTAATTKGRSPRA